MTKQNEERKETKEFMDWVLDEEDLAYILDRCLEWLTDKGYLNKKGQGFAEKFWEEYIHEKD